VVKDTPCHNSFFKWTWLNLAFLLLHQRDKYLRLGPPGQACLSSNSVRTDNTLITSHLQCLTLWGIPTCIVYTVYCCSGQREVLGCCFLACGEEVSHGWDIILTVCCVVLTDGRCQPMSFAPTPFSKSSLQGMQDRLRNKGTGRSTGSSGNIEMLHPLTNCTLTGAWQL
jgi:hypothetical protein